MEEEEREVIELTPENKFLTAEELISFRNAEVPSSKTGPKKTRPDGTQEEKEELQKLHDELRMQLSHPRIEREGGRSVGEWDSEKKAVKVVKKLGKIQNYGYTEDKIQYLENFEALFLLELNRLAIYFDSVLVSVEQAYVLLLGEEKSKEFDYYFVYATFSRAGYNPRRYKNISYDIKITDEDCIFEILQSSVDHTHRISSYVKNYKNYDAIRKSIKEISEKISKSTETDTTQKLERPFSIEDYIDFDKKFPAKRKPKEKILSKNSPKKARLHNVESCQSYLDVLKTEQDYEQFKDIFTKLEIISLKECEDYPEDIKDLEIIFDIYLPKDQFKKSEPKPPTVRAIVLGSTENFPNRSELAKVYHSQEFKVPLLVISVSESKHIQAFLYHFT